MAICGQCGKDSSSFIEAMVNNKPQTVCTTCAYIFKRIQNEATTTPLQKING